MRKRDMEKRLEEAGFKLLRKGKHDIWVNGNWRICIPQGGGPIEARLTKKILVDLKRFKAGKQQLFQNQVVEV